ncbi:MAG: hypothetical protein HKN36_08550 [Hellea sp.]|nr:hypothetical protein [Hellea sp.]
MKFVSPILTVFLTGLITACGSSEVEDPRNAMIMELTPTEVPVAAAYVFMGCEDPVDDVMMCQACDVTVHDDGEKGALAYAAHWKHELRAEGEKGWRNLSSGELADKSFASPERSIKSAAEVFELAQSWCQVRSDKKLKIIKNELTTQFGEPS